MSADIELYRFDMGAESWLYTTADVDQVYGGDTYTSLPGLSRGAIEQTGEAARSQITITLPRSAYPAIMWTVGLPDGVILLSILRRFEDAWVPIWSGRVLGCGYAGIKADLACEPWSTSTRVRGLRRTFCYACPHEFCDSDCSANGGPSAAAWTAVGSVVSISDLTINLANAATFADGTFAGGVLTFNGILRKVISHVGPLLTISRPIPSLQAGSQISVLAGCDKSTATCTARGNIANHGGWPNIPDTNPTSGSPIL